MRRIFTDGGGEIIEMQEPERGSTSHRVMTGENPPRHGAYRIQTPAFLYDSPERVCREQLLNNVWGTNVYVEDRTVDICAAYVSAELSSHDRMVQTVRGTVIVFYPFLNNDRN